MPNISIASATVSMVLLREAYAGPQALLLRRHRPPVGAWCQIVGKIENKETAWQAALRETREETGLTPRCLYSADFCEQFYEAQTDSIIITPVFLGYCEENAQVRLNKEHSAFGWFSFAQALEMVTFCGQRKMLRHIKKEFIDAEPNPWLAIPLPKTEQ